MTEQDLTTERKVHVADAGRYLYIEAALVLGMFVMWAEILGHWS